jgi:hypothetical protein
MQRRPVLHVVSYLAHGQFDPRGVRTRHVIEALQPAWEVDLISGPVAAPHGRRSPIRRGWDYALYSAHRMLAMDPYEMWSLRRLLRWRPGGSCALLIGFPYSPIAYAAHVLRRHRIPYIVDIGDPWALTARALGTLPASRWRGRRAERAVWEGASGAILSTPQQAAALTDLFAHLQVLVRPNGYRAAASSDLPVWSPPADDELHLGHFGRIYGPRIDVAESLNRLASSGRWRRVVLHQFGDVARGALHSLSLNVELNRQAARPWHEIQAAASHLSAALVIGNLSSAQLPSKVVDYLTLPAPRFALVRDPGVDAIANYLADKSGWLIVGNDAEDLPEQVAAHVNRPWTASDLSPPAEEAWLPVAKQIASFVDQQFDVAAKHERRPVQKSHWAVSRPQKP